MLCHPNSREHPFLSVRLGGMKLQPDLLETYERIAQSQERILLWIYFLEKATAEPLLFYQPKYRYHQHLSNDLEMWLKVRRTCISAILRAIGIEIIAIALLRYATHDYNHWGCE